MRWVDLSTVFQSSMNSLNPVITVGRSSPTPSRRTATR